MKLNLVKCKEMISSFSKVSDEAIPNVVIEKMIVERVTSSKVLGKYLINNLNINHIEFIYKKASQRVYHLIP